MRSSSAAPPGTAEGAGRGVRRPLRLLKALLGAAFILVLLRLASGEDFLDMLGRLDPLFFVLSLALSACLILISCLKWQLLLRQQGHDLGLALLLKHYLIGYYFTTILPSSVGGDVVRSYNVGRLIGDQPGAAVSVFLERLTGLVVLLLLVIAAPLFRPDLYDHAAIWVAAGCAALLLVAVLTLSRVGLPSRMLPSRMLPNRMLPGRGAGPLDKVFAACQAFHRRLRAGLAILRRAGRSAWGVLGLTAAFYAVTWVNVYLALRTFGVHAEFLSVAAVTPAVLMVTIIPMPLGSLGLAEGAYVFFLGLVGFSITEALVVGLFLRFKLLLIGLIGFCFHLTD